MNARIESFTGLRCGIFLPIKIDVDEIADDLQDPVPLALKGYCKALEY
jgi:hypothetical protein